VISVHDRTEFRKFSVGNSTLLSCEIWAKI
jgi:hypothetical protein